MTDDKILNLVFDAPLAARARAGQHNFTNKINAAFTPLGFDIRILDKPAGSRLAPDPPKGYNLIHMDEPYDENSLCMRLSYFYPFWRIERRAQRWDWDVAKMSFSPKEIDTARAEIFFQRHRRLQFGAPAVSGRSEGFIYVPLQGQLTRKRSFQSMSPMDMLEQSLTANPNTRFVVSLHPRESYSDQERGALDKLIASHARLTISEVDSDLLLRDCDMVVTQNSGVALRGYFFKKPAVIFGRIDFHHIAGNVHELGVEGAFEFARATRPDYAKYLFWFLKLTTINAGNETAPRQILDRVRALGWQI